jgi:DNA polymerase III subunit epsilon
MKKIAIIDIETSGFQKQGGLIVEIGIVSLDLETGNIKNEFNSIVKESGFNEKHSKHPYGWVFQNSDLTYNDVLSANSLTSVLPEIQNILDKCSSGATAYNKAFDFGFLRSRGLQIKELDCIMLSATPVVGLPPNFGHNTPKWPNVEEAWEYFFPTVEYKEKHRALDDAKHEALIAFELFKLGKL